LSQEHWQQLAGTTADWLLMSQGRRLLSVKGTKGGERAMPSSFAISAAAYGRTAAVLFLEGSASLGGAQPQCVWKPVGEFS
jgi:hypothetical protein